MVRLLAVLELHVEIARERIAERAAKFLHEHEIEIAHEHHRRLHVVHEAGPAAQVHDHARQRLVHGQVEKSVAADAGLGPERLFEGFSQHQADVLDRVVIIDGDVALRLHFEIEEAVLGEKREHVIEEWDARVDLAHAAAVEAERELDVGFGRLARDGCYAEGAAVSHASMVLVRTSISSSVPTLMRRKGAVKAWLGK